MSSGLTFDLAIASDEPGSSWTLNNPSLGNGASWAQPPEKSIPPFGPIQYKIESGDNGFQPCYLDFTCAGTEILITCSWDGTGQNLIVKAKENSSPEQILYEKNPGNTGKVEYKINLNSPFQSVSC